MDYGSTGGRPRLPRAAKVGVIGFPVVLFGLLLNNHIGRHESVGRSIGHAVPALIAVGIGDLVFFLVIRPKAT